MIVAHTDWQINDIAIYTPKEPKNKAAFIVGGRYIVQSVLQCECGSVLLSFGFNFNIYSQSQIKTKCICDKIHCDSDRIWVLAAPFRKQSFPDYVRQRLVEEKFKHEG